MGLAEEREVPAKTEWTPVGLTVIKKGCGATFMNYLAGNIVLYTCLLYKLISVVDEVLEYIFT